MIIKPYTQFDSADELAATTANFPSLKHFFACNETSGTTLTDSVSGNTITAAAMTFVANGVVPNPGAAANLAYSGTLTAPGTDSFVLLAVGKFNGTAAIQYGTVASTGGIALTRAQAISLFDGANECAGTAFTDGTTTTYGRANTVDNGGGAAWVTQQNFEATTTSTITTLAGVAASTATPATIAGGIAVVDASLRFDSNTTALYGLALFTFAGALPVNTAAAVAWMTYQWANGNKVIYPGWKGLA